MSLLRSSPRHDVVEGAGAVERRLAELGEGHGSTSCHRTHRPPSDPFLTGNPLAPVKADTVQADSILVSHGHGDHVGDTVAIAGRTGATVIANFEVHKWLATQGVKNGHPQPIGGGFNYPWGRVKLTIAHHASALPDGSYGGNPCGFLLSARRFVALEGEPKYLAIYDLESPEVLQSEAYKKIYGPSAWTQRISTHFVRSIRNVYVEITPEGVGEKR